ncbi:MAG TPA: helix-turn-helix transcriptional regulator [Candidatus Baltobacteraceae bacterium]|nr:helix-turn-helix transcriptional regulator [Candidatus Baltobacteraceae bacterium]
MKEPQPRRMPSAEHTEDDVSSGRADSGLPPRGTPKNYLMAWLLVMLKDLNLHGYEIMKELRENFAVVTDPGTVYRALRQLERDGYITSWWDSKEHGPARRVYTLTDAGTDALKLWSTALEQYRTNLDAFFSLYTGTWVKDRPDSPKE